MSEPCPSIECCPTSPFGTTIVSTAYQNVRQCYTASCPQGQTGADVTYCVAAGTVTSYVSQEDADAIAYAQAVETATDRLSCAGQADCVNWMPAMSGSTTDGFTVQMDSGVERVGYESWRAFDGNGSWVPYAGAFPKGIKIGCPYDTTLWGLRIFVGDDLDGQNCKLTLHGASDIGLLFPLALCDDIILTNYSFVGNKVAGTLIELPVPHTNRGWHLLIFKDNSPAYTQDILFIEMFACEPAPIPT